MIPGNCAFRLSYDDKKKIKIDTIIYTAITFQKTPDDVNTFECYLLPIDRKYVSLEDTKAPHKLGLSFLDESKKPICNYSIDIKGAAHKHESSKYVTTFNENNNCCLKIKSCGTCQVSPYRY